MPSLMFKNWKLNWIASLPIGASYQTRRLMKPQPGSDIVGYTPHGDEFLPKVINAETGNVEEYIVGDVRKRIKPRLQPGQTVYLKEGLRRHYNDPSVGCDYATYTLDFTPVMVRGSLNRYVWRWQKDYLSPLHLPEAAARHFALVESVRAERVKAISPADVIAEGTWGWLRQYRPNLWCGNQPVVSPLDAYCLLLDWTHGKPITASNPYVLAYTLVKVERR